MATAKIISTPPLPPPPPEVHLTLTMREAEVLRRVIDNIGGCPSRSARGVTDRIGLALHDAGVKVAKDVPLRGGICF